MILLQLVLWSGVAMSTALVHTETELIVNRFALGLAEGGDAAGRHDRADPRLVHEGRKGRGPTRCSS